MVFVIVTEHIVGCSVKIRLRRRLLRCVLQAAAYWRHLCSMLLQLAAIQVFFVINFVMLSCRQ